MSILVTTFKWAVALVLSAIGTLISAIGTLIVMASLGLSTRLMGWSVVAAASVDNVIWR